MVSCTVSVNVAVAWLPEKSVAVAVMVVSPRGNVIGAGGSRVTTGVASQMSVAVTVTS